MSGKTEIEPVSSPLILHIPNFLTAFVAETHQTKEIQSRSSNGDEDGKNALDSVPQCMFHPSHLLRQVVGLTISITSVRG